MPKSLPFTEGSIDRYIGAVNDTTSRELHDVKSRQSLSGAGWIALLFAPPIHFFRAYVMSGGFRSGVRGFINAGCESLGVLVGIAKRWEYRLWQRGYLKEPPPVTDAETEQFRKW